MSPATDLRRRTRRLFAFGKGIVALDAPHRPITPTCANPDRTTSGVVLAADALLTGPASVPDRLRAAGLLLGARADRGCEPLTADSLVTSGLDGLTERLGRLHAAGARFAVWHVPPTEPGGRSAPYALAANAHAAARFARTCHDLGLVPLLRVYRQRAGHDAAQATGLVGLVSQLDEFDVELDSLVVCTRFDRTIPLVGSALAALPTRLGGVALAVDAFTPAAAADSIADTRAAGAPWPVTFYLGREATTPIHSLRRAHDQNSRRRARR